jgi:hypothetical protein
MTISTWTDEKAGRVASALVTFGQIGFWIQLVFLIVVVILGGYVFRIIGGTANLDNLLALLGLVLPVFTTLWCRHYLGLGRRLEDPVNGPGPETVRKRAWVGVWAGTLGTAVSLLSLFGAASALLVTMLANPQVGIQVSPATGASAYSISAIDAVSLMALVLTLASELLVVAISLRIVFLVIAPTPTGKAA